MYAPNFLPGTIDVVLVGQSRMLLCSRDLSVADTNILYLFIFIWAWNAQECEDQPCSPPCFSYRCSLVGPPERLFR